MTLSAELYAALCALVALGIGLTIGYAIGRRHREAETEWRDFSDLPPLDPEDKTPFDWKRD